MFTLRKTILLCAMGSILYTISPVQAEELLPTVGSDFPAGTAMAIQNPQGEPVIVPGGRALLRTTRGIDTGTVISDGKNGFVHVTGDTPMDAATQEYADARELKLKIRELAEQLLGRGPEKALRGVTALPTSFVNQDNFEQSSSFGRYVAEQLFHEFNQRGFPVQEYRMHKSLAMRQGEGDFLLTRQNQQISPAASASVFVTGTYYRDKYSVFVNARMVRVSDGLVLRTGQLVFPVTGVTARMLAARSIRLESTYVGMQDFETMTRAVDLTSIDLGDDIH